jgi:hypothetical protein
MTSMRIQHTATVLAKALASLLQQLRRDREVHERRIDVFVTEVGRQIRQTRLGIDASVIPGQHAVDHKGVAKIMYAWARFPLGWLEARSSEHTDKQAFNRGPGVATLTLLMPEEAGRGLHGGAGFLPGFAIGVEGGEDARRQWKSTRFEEFRFPDLDRPVVEMHITEGQARELSKPKARAHGEDHHHVKTQGAQRRFGRGKGPGRVQDSSDVVGRADIGTPMLLADLASEPAIHTHNRCRWIEPM